VYKRYEECRVAYNDLLESGAEAAELTRALAEWAVNGKAEVEAALATLARLARRSTLPLADEQQALLDPAFLASTVDGSYAATEFAPLSAIRPATWLAAEVTFDDLERAIGGGPREKWTVWRAGRTGTLRFRFAALDLRRSWFSQAIYEADDWRLVGEPVSAGDGIGGRLPAYVSSVYLAIVDEVRANPKPKIDTQTPPIFIPPHLPDRRLVTTRLTAGPALAVARPLAVSARPRLGVSGTGSADRPAPPVVSRPNLAALRVNRLGVVSRPTRFVVAERLALADVLARPGGTTTRPADAAFVVGFGCTTLPPSPRPNPGYQWPSN
jgi:hypothetical protein